jgi:hypothetical protein
MTTWPAAGKALIQELRNHPGRLALIEDPAAAQETNRALAELAGAAPFNASRALMREPVPISSDEVLGRLAGEPVLIALDALFWKPWLSLDPLMVLRRLARRDPPILALWPGAISEGSVSYSAAGRPDYFAATLEDAVVLRPKATMYPDEVPYVLERR